MSEDCVVDAFGARWSFDTDALRAVDAERLRVLWERCRVRGAGADDVGVEPFVVTDSDPYAVSRAITLASLERRRGSAVLLHAAGLSRGERAIALVGPSGAGKSTASRVLGQHFGYLTDETVAIEADGRVAPYPKPLSIITDPAAPWDKGEWSPDELGLRKASEPAYLTGLVVLERDPARTVPELVELPLIDALLAVIAQSSSLPVLDRPLHRLAEVASGSGGPYLLRYSEIGDCIDLLAALFGADPKVAAPPLDLRILPHPFPPRAQTRRSCEHRGGTRCTARAGRSSSSTRHRSGSAPSARSCGASPPRRSHETTRMPPWSPTWVRTPTPPGQSTTASRNSSNSGLLRVTP